MSAEPPPEPSKRLPPAAKSLWRLQGLFNGVFTLILAGVGGAAAGDPWQDAALAIAGGYLLLALTVLPEMRHRRWRYEVREHEIDIRHGTFAVTRTIVPMRRIQHVETSRGVLEQAFDLATVTFHTAAGGTSIPALLDFEATSVRTRIAELARTADEL